MPAGYDVADVKTLSSMLGHYSAGFTLDTYTHITTDMQRGAAEKIGGFMQTATAATTSGRSRPWVSERMASFMDFPPLR